MYVFGLEMILIDKRIELKDPSGRINEDKNSIKKDKQSIMLFKINMFGLPSTFQKKEHVNHEFICIFWPRNDIDK